MEDDYYKNLIDEHNKELKEICDDKSHCGRFPWDRMCPDCPEHYLIEYEVCIK